MDRTFGDTHVYKAGSTLGGLTLLFALAVYLHGIGWFPALALSLSFFVYFTEQPLRATLRENRRVKMWFWIISSTNFLLPLLVYLIEGPLPNVVALPASIAHGFLMFIFLFINYSPRRLKESGWASRGK